MTMPRTPAVLTGHIGRVRLFQELMTDSVTVSGLPCLAVRGNVDGAPILVLGTGMGGPATVRATHAVAELGCNVVIRAGGAGPVAPDTKTGDLLVATAAVRHEGASDGYLPDGWPALADPDVVAALCRATLDFGERYKAGVVHSKDSFFGEIDPMSSPVSEVLLQRWSAWVRLGVLGSEMEAAALFAVASHLGLRAGAILRVNDVDKQAGNDNEPERQLCRIVLRAAAALGTSDD